MNQIVYIENYQLEHNINLLFLFVFKILLLFYIYIHHNKFKKKLQNNLICRNYVAQPIPREYIFFCVDFSLTKIIFRNACPISTHSYAVMYSAA